MGGVGGGGDMQRGVRGGRGTHGEGCRRQRCAGGVEAVGIILSARGVQDTKSVGGAWRGVRQAARGGRHVDTFYCQQEVFSMVKDSKRNKRRVEGVVVKLGLLSFLGMVYV